MQSETPACVRAMLALPDAVVGRTWWQPSEFPDYMVGDDGTVISLIREPRVLRPGLRGRYRGFVLRDRAGRQRAVYLHRLVAESFHGPCPPGEECRHLNGDRFDNDMRNLAWGTRQENVDDVARHGNSLTGERNPMARLTGEAVREMRRLRAATGASYAEIARRFGVSTMTAYRAIVGQAWRTE
jgi:hypothetical protein